MKLKYYLLANKGERINITTYRINLVQTVRPCKQNSGREHKSKEINKRPNLSLMHSNWTTYQQKCPSHDTCSKRGGDSTSRILPRKCKVKVNGAQVHCIPIAPRHLRLQPTRGEPYLSSKVLPLQLSPKTISAAGLFPSTQPRPRSRTGCCDGRVGGRSERERKLRG